MPKRRQIPFLREPRHAGGQYSWQPSKSRAAQGWEFLSLGTDKNAAYAAALERNRQLAQWDRDRAALSDAPYSPDGEAAHPLPPAPRLIRWDGLIARYRASADYRACRPATRREYDSRIRALTLWALDGQLPLVDLDKKMLRNLRDTLRTGSAYRAAALWRVLRLLLNFAVEQGLIGTNPMTGLKMPVAPARGYSMGITTAEWLARTAVQDPALGGEAMALLIQIGFWTVQRQADLLALTRMAWRQIDNIEARDAAALANARGEVWGFRLRQQKTGAWVDAPVPPMFHAAIERRWQSGAETLFTDPANPNAKLSPWRTQRLFRALVTAASAQAQAHGHPLIVKELEQCQFRDLRRSGMMFYSDSGARTAWITALSGHKIMHKASILDTYMPPDTPGAAAAVATGLRHWKSRYAQDQTG